MDELETGKITKLDAALACGRFQPFHNEHLRYILAALGRSNFLWIGITKPWRKILQDSPSHREMNSANPFDFITRVRMIRQALLECGVDSRKFQIIPFDFESTEKINDCDPPCKEVLVTITDEWSQVKLQKLKDIGKIVEILYENSYPKITGTAIRESILKADDIWRELVPPAVETIVEEHISDVKA